MDNSEEIREALKKEGAPLVGITAAEKIREIEDRINEAGSEGRLASMDWLTRSAKKRSDPLLHLPGARSVVLSIWPYSDGGQRFIARYAQHKDYHVTIKEKMQRAWMRAFSNQYAVKYFVDSGAIGEKVYAMKAGLGWIGKNALLINKEYGSFFCIGTIITDLKLKADSEADEGCGDCDRCINSCPTGAIISAGKIDSRRCLSYLTTEHKGEIEEELKPFLKETLFGCDVCQEACPYNSKKRMKSALVPEKIEIKSIKDILSLDEKKFDKMFGKTPIKRLGLDRLKRNATIVLENLRQSGL